MYKDKKEIFKKLHPFEVLKTLHEIFEKKIFKFNLKTFENAG